MINIPIVTDKSHGFNYAFGKKRMDSRSKFYIDLAIQLKINIFKEHLQS